MPISGSSRFPNGSRTELRFFASMCLMIFEDRLQCPLQEVDIIIRNLYMVSRKHVLPLIAEACFATIDRGGTFTSMSTALSFLMQVLNCPLSSRMEDEWHYMWHFHRYALPPALSFNGTEVQADVDFPGSCIVFRSCHISLRCFQP